MFHIYIGFGFSDKIIWFWHVQHWWYCSIMNTRLAEFQRPIFEKTLDQWLLMRTRMTNQKKDEMRLGKMIFWWLKNLEYPTIIDSYMICKYKINVVVVVLQNYNMYVFWLICEPWKYFCYFQSIGFYLFWLIDIMWLKLFMEIALFNKFYCMLLLSKRIFSPEMPMSDDTY